MLRLLRFVAGAAVAIALWWYGTPAYNRALALAAHAVFQHTDARIGNAAIEPVDRWVAVRPGTATPRITVPADQLTYNVVLFGGLMAAIPPRRAWRGIVAFLVLVAFHALALIVNIEATYATHLGAWSDSHYSALAQDFWNSADFIYRIGGMFAIAFVCWYAATFLDAREPQRGSARKSPTAERRRPRAAAPRR